VPGHLITTNIAANQGYLIYNGSQVGLDTSFIANSLSQAQVAVFNSYSGTGFGRGSNLICGFYSIGYGLTVSECSIFYNAVQVLQTALGRQV
jgi:hypothetical protein